MRRFRTRWRFRGAAGTETPPYGGSSTAATCLGCRLVGDSQLRGVELLAFAVAGLHGAVQDAAGQERALNGIGGLAGEEHRLDRLAESGEVAEGFLFLEPEVRRRGFCLTGDLAREEE